MTLKNIPFFNTSQKINDFFFKKNKIITKTPIKSRKINIKLILKKYSKRYKIVIFNKFSIQILMAKNSFKLKFKTPVSNKKSKYLSSYLE